MHRLVAGRALLTLGGRIGARTWLLAGAALLAVFVVGLVASSGGGSGRAAGPAALGEKLTVAVAAVVFGVAGAWLGFVLALGAVERLGRLAPVLRPWVFVGPALALIGLFLVYPMLSTILDAVTLDGGAARNFGDLAADASVWLAIRNNALWLVLGTGGSVGLGLLTAVLFDRVRGEAVAKAVVFLPMAISMAGAATIWRFVYAWRPPGEPQIGLLNAVWTASGAEPVAWVQAAPLNTPLLIVIMIWLQAGFAMVVLSAAIKAVPREILEAARVDGATEPALFRLILLPIIRPSIVAVTTTVAIMVLKVFDIVFVMTGGNFETDVIANRMFRELVTYRDFGHASALAVVLFLAVLPIGLLSVRSMVQGRVVR
ncbi:MAG TPA: sugar ABC transporter permease [Candidatus Binatia bacterium]|nr:sugar ABC transporter permease [Candidatus Binatia bacterium]